MYVVTVCPNCTNFWIINGTPNSSQCRRCLKQFQYKKLQKLRKTESIEEARAIRASAQAKYQGDEEMFDRAVKQSDILTEVEIDLNDESYLKEMGVNVDEVKEVEQKTMSSNGSRSQKEIIEDAVRENEPATPAEVVSYAQEYQVDAEKAYSILEKLHRGGQIRKTTGGKFKEI